MDLIQIYECFCDETRLRILHLLSHGPLCVCHFQTILGQSQVRISKHLAYLKDRGLVVATRHQNWMIYCLPSQRPPELDKNLRCLQDCVQTHPVFAQDRQALRALQAEVEWIAPALDCCPEPLQPLTASRRAKPSTTTRSCR